MTTIIMAEEQRSLLRLQAWLSPAFPVGAFAYSHGLEQAIFDGLVTDRTALVDWLETLLAHGSVWNDAVLLAEAWRRVMAGEDVAEVAALAEATAGTKERHMETTLQGAAFGEAVAAWGGAADQQPQADRCPYPVAVAVAAARHGIAIEPTLAAYLHGFTANLVQTAIRLVPLGQRDGTAALVSLEPAILDVAKRASASTLDDLGSCTIMSDILSMRHETLYSRVFRS
ncbi:MAG TPA: urease accessory protein UreF [Rhizobiaceae bacterium]|nr:urease accessory protein UreF [Rhizobiaceae bacterium]